MKNPSEVWTRERAALHGWSIFVTILTFILLCSGGLVTSHGVGMAVPDWPNTFGYNMFLFPFSKWVGGIFFEHSHRLIATFVGLFTAVLAGWLWSRETKGSERGAGLVAMVFILGLLGVREMPVYYALAAFSPIVAGYGIYRFLKNREELRWLGIVAYAAVILQGVLGGLRVVWFKDEIGVFHGMLAQAFFVFLAILSVMLSRSYVESRYAEYEPSANLKWWAFGATALIFLQLGLGATMRHEHIGLSIPDFPLAYGQIIPDTSAAALEAINAKRLTEEQMPTTAVQIWVQMTHRFVALLICVAVGVVFAKALRSARAVRWRAAGWFALILVQAGFGAWTIWSQKAADVATAHMALGAISFLFGGLLTFRLFLGARSEDFVLPDAPNRRLMERFA